MRDPSREGLAAGWQYIDASELTEDKQLEADVVIVGSGAGGGVTAELLTRAGLKVLIIEEGPLRSTPDFRMREADAYPQLYQESAARKTDEFARGMVMGGTLFEELGFYYVGPIYGHNLEQLVPVLENVRDAAEGPCLIHVVTQKGKGYAPAEAAEDKYHGVQKFDVVTGEQAKAPPGRCL